MTLPSRGEVRRALGFTTATIRSLLGCGSSVISPVKGSSECSQFRHSGQLDSRHCHLRNVIIHLVKDFHHAAVTGSIQYADNSSGLPAERICMTTRWLVVIFEVMEQTVDFGSGDLHVGQLYSRYWKQIRTAERYLKAQGLDQNLLSVEHTSSLYLDA